MNNINILIADDHSMIREGLKQIIELEGDIFVVGQASDGFECLENIKNNTYDVMVLDIDMPKMDGLEVVRALNSTEISSKVILLTFHNEVEYLTKAIELGIHGYVLKDSGSESLIKAIRTVNNGDIYIEPDMVTSLFKKSNNPTNKTTSMKTRIICENMYNLTERELQMLKFLVKGLTNKEIAASLNISEKTVKNHVTALFKKLGVSDRTQAAVLAIKQHLIQL